MPDPSVRFLGSELSQLSPRNCRFHVIPVPFEATVSYGGGTAQGPSAIIEASQQLEVWTGRSNPSEQGIFTWPDVNCRGDAEEVLKRIENAVAEVLAIEEVSVSSRKEKQSVPVPVILGGEHSITLGALRALQKRYGDFGVVQFDAHADLRDTYEGSPYSHACVMRRVVDDLGLPLFQIGVRSLSPDEVGFRKAKNIPCLDARQAGFPLLQGNKENSRETASVLPGFFPDKIFLTFDIDALDASLMPATGTPEPGGLFWWDALNLIERALAGRTCLGFDVVELAPIPNMHAPNYTAARLVYEIMGII